MNLLAYFIIHPVSAPVAVVWLINIIIYCIFAVILYYILQWVAGEFGVPPKIVKLFGLLIFLALVLMLFVGCATDSEGVTRFDTKGVAEAVSAGVGTYDRIAHPEYYRPSYPVAGAVLVP